MSSYLCFICHNIVVKETSDDYRDKFRELIGMNLFQEAYLCSLCCHMLDKFWYFKSICLKRSFEYPVLYNERGTLNLQKRDLNNYTICNEDDCNNNDNIIHYMDINDSSNQDYDIFKAHLQLPHIENEYINHYTDVQKEFVDNNDITVFKNDTISKEAIITGTEFTSHNQNDNFSIIEEQNNDVDYDNVPIDDNNDEDCNYEIATNINDVDNNENAEKPKVKSKKKKKEFDKIFLSVEEQKAELERRRKEKKYIEAEFKCYNCALGFLFKDTYQAHMMRHEESNGEYRCDICTLRFATPRVLRAHVTLHSCIMRCRRCGRMFPPRGEGRHRASCGGGEEVACHMCARMFSKESINITLHSCIMRCRRCHRTFPPRGEGRHRASCGGGEEVACHMCARMFRHSAALQQHLKRFHRSPSARGYRCSVCGNTYRDQAAVRTHMIKHVQRKFPCGLCSSTFSSPYTLARHSRSHDLDTREVLSCEVCDRTFRDKSSLKRHLMRHRHAEEGYTCPICSRACASQRSLNYHVESIHSNTKNFACDRCSARYNTAEALQRHRRGHDVKIEVMLAVCYLCGKTFKGNNKLNRHLREVCEKEKLEEQLSSYYAQDEV